MRFYEFPSEKLEEYRRGIQRIKQRNPDAYYPSQAARELLCLCMYLRHYGAAINMADALGDTKLCEEIKSENEKYPKVKDVINTKFSPYKDTPLRMAVERKCLGTAEGLLDHGAKVLPDKKGGNPVFEACYEECIPALNMFKHHGVDLNQPYFRWEWKKCIPQKTAFYPIEVALCSKRANFKNCSVVVG